MPQFIDMAGKTCGYFKVLRRGPNWQKCIRWWCRCKCGSEVLVFGTILRNGRSKSCGCRKIEKMTTHGCSGRVHRKLTTEYSIWGKILDRCNNPRNKQYPRYGGRGISVCKRWYKFENFLEDMSKRPSNFNIDRINNNGNYCKRNCRWASKRLSALNRENSISIRYRGQTKYLTEWADYLNIPRWVIYNRMRRGYSFKRAIDYSPC